MEELLKTIILKEWNTNQIQDAVQSFQCSVGESQIATSEQNNHNTQHINASDGTEQETNVIGASSGIPNTNDVSSDDVNRSEIVEEMSCQHSEKTNSERSGNDISTIGASDQKHEILKTYSIAAELVDAIHEKEGNTVLMFDDNHTDEASAVAEKETEQNTDHDMLSDLDIDSLKDIPDKTDLSAKNSGSGNISDNVESNESEHEIKISEHKIESDPNMRQFSDSDFTAHEGSNNENEMDSDENLCDDDNVKDNEEEKSCRQSDNDENTFQDVNMEAKENESDINDNMSDILQYDTEPEGKTTGKDSDSAKEGEVDNDRTEKTVM